MSSFDIIQEKIKNKLDSFVSNITPVTQKSKNVNQSKTHPSNKNEFKKRLFSFDDKFWILPEISPLKCAQFGWSYHHANMLHCSSCEVFLCTLLPCVTQREEYKKRLEILKRSLIERHETWCMWRETSCPSSFLLPPSDLSVHYLNDLRSIVSRFISLDSNLPYFNIEEILSKLEIEKDDLKVLIQSNELDDKKVSACILALCGWSIDENSKNTFRCNLCLSTVGLWIYYSLAEKEDYLQTKYRHQKSEEAKARNVLRKKRRIERIQRIEEKRFELEKKRKAAEKELEDSIFNDDCDSSSSDEEMQEPVFNNKVEDTGANSNFAEPEKCNESGGIDVSESVTHVVMADSSKQEDYDIDHSSRREVENDNLLNITDKNPVTISNVESVEETLKECQENGSELYDVTDKTTYVDSGDDEDMWMAALGYKKESNDSIANNNMKQDSMNVLNNDNQLITGSEQGNLDNESSHIETLSSDDETVSPQKSHIDISSEGIQYEESMVSDEEKYPSDEEGFPTEDEDSEENVGYNENLGSDEEDERLNYEDIPSDEEKLSDNETRILNEETLSSDEDEGEIGNVETSSSEGERRLNDETMSSSGEDTEHYNPNSPPVETISSDDDEPVSSEHSKFHPDKEVSSETSQEPTVSSSDAYIPQVDGPLDCMDSNEASSSESEKQENESGESGHYDNEQNVLADSKEESNCLNIGSNADCLTGQTESNSEYYNATDNCKNVNNLNKIHSENVHNKDVAENVNLDRNNHSSASTNIEKSTEQISHNQDSYLNGRSRKRKFSDSDILQENKKVCLDPDPEDDEPIVSDDEEVEKVQYSKRPFDPIGEHRNWCGCLSLVIHNGLEEKAFKILPSQLNRYISKLNTDCLTSTEKYANNVEGVSEVRSILTNAVTHDLY